MRIVSVNLLGCQAFGLGLYRLSTATVLLVTLGPWQRALTIAGRLARRPGAVAQ